MPSLNESRKRAKDERLQAHKMSEDLYVVYNVVKGTSYDVLQTIAGTWHCTCPYATKGSRVAAGECKHLVRVLDKEAPCSGCGVKDDTIKDRKCVQCRSYEKIMG